MTEKMKIGTSAVVNLGATSTVEKTGDEFIPTDKLLQEVFEMPTGEETKASTKTKFHHKVREPARTVDMVPNLSQKSLLSVSKFSDAKYVTVLTPEEAFILMIWETYNSQFPRKPSSKGEGARRQDCGECH